MRDTFKTWKPYLPASRRVLLALLDRKMLVHTLTGPHPGQLIQVYADSQVKQGGEADYKVWRMRDICI